MASGQPGTSVGLIANNDVASVISIFAVLRAGFPCLFLNPTDPINRLKAILAEHRVSQILHSTPVDSQLSELTKVIDTSVTSVIDQQIAFYQTDLGSLPELPLPGDQPHSAELPAFLFGTSGSTAASKVAVQSHRALFSNAEALRLHLRLDTETTLIGVLPIYHVNGVHFSLIATLHAGAHVVLPEEFSALSYRDLLGTHGPNIASVVPAILNSLLVTGRGWSPPKTLRYFVSAASPLHRDVAKRVLDMFGVRVLQGYGLTETTNFATMMPTDLPLDEYRAVTTHSKVPSVGIAVPGNEVEILDGSGNLLGDNQIGEICMRGQNLMTGYAGRPDLTERAFKNGWFHSGDLGYWNYGSDQRRFFYITGREKNVAKVRGTAVSLEEVEQALLSLHSVTDAGCIAVPHSTWGEQIVAVVSPRKIDSDQLREELALLLPAVAIPTRWRLSDTVPRNRVGKLQRKRLLGLVIEPPP